MKSARALKKDHYHEEAEAETWALSYGDMITLLLSFFVIYFTTDFKEEKVNQLNRHLSFSLEGALTASPEHVNPNAKADAATSPEEAKNFLPNFDIAQVKAVAVGDMVVVSFGNISFFETASTKVHASGISVLEQFTKKYLPFAGNYRLSIKGFTDKRPVVNKNPKYTDNLELSALRSISAMRVLQKSGIPLNRMDIAGVGEMSAIEKILPDTSGMSQAEINAVSRTIIIVVKPERESWL